MSKFVSVVKGIILLYYVNFTKEKTEKQKNKLKYRMEKNHYQLKLQKETRDYNLGTSLRNYIDPRIMKTWLDYVGLDWKKVHTTTLQRKFRWIELSYR